jgi:ABC-type Co2+ transport system permease subunit
MYGLDFWEIIRRALKYLIEGIVVSLAAYYIPQKRRLNIEEILMIAVTAAATFAILDMYTPAIGEASRLGAGFGVGANLVGGIASPIPLH